VCDEDEMMRLIVNRSRKDMRISRDDSSFRWDRRSICCRCRSERWDGPEKVQTGIRWSGFNF
jgi:hypothetical protein